MSSKSIPIYIVDAFSKQRFAGNSAAICVLDFHQVLATELMQKIAAEMNLSETAFVTPVHEGDSFSTGSQFHLRWFSPTCEVPLCGHATLATASVLINVYQNLSKQLVFETYSGKLVASRMLEGKIAIDLPSYAPEPVVSIPISKLVTAVVGELPVQEVLMSPSNKLLIRLGDTVMREELEALQPNEKDLLSFSKGIKVVGVIVSLSGYGKSDCVSETGERYDFISRYFAPWLGILEDPVTGSAHSVLGPYWSDVLDKTTLFARQCSKRGGELYIQVSGERTIISGDSVVTLEGRLNI